MALRYFLFGRRTLHDAGWLSRTWGVEIATGVDGDPDLDSDLKAILLKALDPDSATRYASIQEFHAVLAAYLEEIWPGRSW